MVAVATEVGEIIRAEDRLGTTVEEEMKEEGLMEAEVDRMMEVDTEEAMEVDMAVDEVAEATTTTTGMKGEEGSDKEVEDAKETSRASRPTAIKEAHEAATTTEMEVVDAEVEEASTEGSAAEITSLPSQAPLLLHFLKIQKMPNLKNVASSPTSSR